MKRKYVLLAVLIVVLATSAVLAGFIFSGGGELIQISMLEGTR